VNPQTLFGDFGWRELVFIAAIVALLAGASRLTRLRPAASAAVGNGAEGAASHAYPAPLPAIDRGKEPGMKAAEGVTEGVRARAS
jgi:hypothetical protein